MNVKVKGQLIQTPHQVRRDESLVCGSCRMTFDANRRLPLSLQCFHSCCEPCVTGMTHGGKHGKKIACAQCKKTTKVDNSGRNGSVLPVNYAILEMVSVNGRTVPGPVTVGGMCDAPGLVRSAYEQVTVIPVKSRDASRQVSCKENRVPTGRSYGQHEEVMISTNASNQCSGTANMSARDAKSNCAKQEKVLPSSEISKAHASTTYVAVTSSLTNGCSPLCPPNSQTLCQPPVGPTSVQSLAPTVTSLTVKTQGSHPTSSNPPCQPSALIDLCCQCRVNPVAVTVTNAAQMSSRKLCANCHALVQRREEEELKVPMRNPAPQSRRNNANQTPEGPATTVIKVSEENCNSHTAVAPEPPKRCEPALHQLPILRDDSCHRRSIHVDGFKGISAVQQPIKIKDTLAAGEDRPTEGISKEDGPHKQPPTKLAYQACSKFDLGTLRFNGLSTVEKQSVAESRLISKDVRADASEDLSNEDIYRPLPYNPGFIGTAVVPSLQPLQPEAPTIDAAYPPIPNSSDSSPGTFSEKQPLGYQEYQPPAPLQYPFPPGAPPKYEEIVGQSTQKVPLSSVRLVRCFGKYGEMAAQPGAFRSPGRVNVSKSGVVVVSDSAHRTVQAFSQDGQCLALIRIAANGVGGCSCYDNSKLAVGTSTGVQVYDLNGVLKKTIPLGQVVNTVGTLDRGFIAVHPKTLYVFRGPNETLVRTLRGSSTLGSTTTTRQPILFDCISDAAVNSQKVAAGKNL